VARGSLESDFRLTKLCDSKISTVEVLVVIGLINHKTIHHYLVIHLMPAT
jgi:hypothetical protein